MYRLIKITGVDPEEIKEIERGDDVAPLYAKRDKLQAKALAAGYTMDQLRYAVRYI